MLNLCEQQCATCRGPREHLARLSSTVRAHTYSDPIGAFVMKRLAPILMLAWLSYAASYACTCGPLNSPNVEYQQSDVVFAGTVINIQADTISGNDYIVTFAVVERWKGASGSETTVWTAIHGAACGFPFELDSTYLVYGSNWDSTRAYTSICNRTCDIHAAGEDLTFLKSATSAPTSIEPSATQKLTINGYPNPANPTVIVSYSVPTSTMINVSLYSMSGALIEILYDGFSRAGVSELNVNAARLSSGVYFARITSEHGVAITKLSIVR